MLRVCSVACVLVTLLSASAFAQTPAPRTATAATEKAPRTAVKATGEKAQVINLNTATAAELEGLPGVGPKVAARIVDYRTKKGPFHKIEELMNVQGIGEKSFLKLRTQLTVAGATAASQQ